MDQKLQGWSPSICVCNKSSTWFLCTVWIWASLEWHTVDGLDRPFTISGIILVGSRNAVSGHLSSERPVIVPSRMESPCVRSSLLSRAFWVHNSSMAIKRWHSKAFPPFPSGVTLTGHYSQVLHEIQHSVCHDYIQMRLLPLLHSHCFKDSLDTLSHGWPYNLASSVGLHEGLRG